MLAILMKSVVSITVDFVVVNIGIGVGYGGSILMWRDFFPHARIYGVDLSIHLATMALPPQGSSSTALDACYLCFPSKYKSVVFANN